MRLVVVIVLLAVALYRSWIDWQATIGEGYAFRLTSIDRTMAETWPVQYQTVVTAWQNTSIPYLWDPIGRTFLAMPLPLVLGVIAALLWVTRSRERGRR